MFVQQITKKLQKREQILEGLFAAMSKAGGANSSVTEIAAAAGIARGALHYYFESKDEIRVCLMARLGDRYIGRLKRALERAGGDGRDMLHALFVFHFGGNTGETARMMSVWVDFWGQAQTDPEVRDEVLSVQRRARAEVGRVIAAATGERVAEDDARCASILALIEGSLLQWRIARESDTPLNPHTLQVQLEKAAAGIIGMPAVPDEKAA